MVTRRGIVLVFTLVLLITFSSSAQQVYFTNEGKGLLQLLDLNSNPPQVTTLYSVGAKLDDLILNSAGQLIYSTNAGVDLYDPVTGQNTELVSLKNALDLMIEPGGQTMLIAVYTGQILRYNFATGATTVLLKVHETFDGIAYDPYGNLYAVAGHNTIIQIDPVAGAILNTLVLEPHHGINGGDGMTYDSYTGCLWVTHDGTTGNGLLQIPITAAGLGSTFSFYPTPLVHAPDGIKSDGKGNLYIGAIWTLAVYNIPTNTITQNVTVKGADGVSLVPGTY
jgi:ligand-binding sensor domain-containing protein